MKTSVVEPLQSAFENIQLPSIPTPNLHMPANVAEHLPATVTEHLPEMFRPESKSRSKWPLVLALIVAAAVAMWYSRRRRTAAEDIGTYNGSPSSYSSDASFVDVR